MITSEFLEFHIVPLQLILLGFLIVETTLLQFCYLNGVRTYFSLAVKIFVTKATKKIRMIDFFANLA